ncbi:GmrSD restriction endonuclease domain-containing protein [Micromonospora sp. CA-111912]|uniref:GmrSD restriction endonuclease domain-containing protein n=1 Tax=Micromonospora sp. CA-111912 TaxID=3239955 RepID=UPI003D8AF56A
MVAAHETTLRELLEGAKQYRVPLYQRTYSWTDSQLQRLWDDIRGLAGERTKDPSLTHFIGSLVLAPSPTNGPAGVSEFLVVDGQQRLTTLSILLCALRDHRAQHEGPDHRDRIDQEFLINKYKPAHRFKIVPTQADRSAYQACLEATPQAGGSDRVGAAYRYFVAQLAAGADDPDDPLDMEHIEDAIISGMALVSVVAQAGDNVYRIFESLNNTGLKLTQADLLRNYLFMRLPSRGEAVYNSLWFPLQQQLDSGKLEQLFWLDLVHRNPEVKQTDTYTGQQARLNGLHNEEEIEAEVRRFCRLGALLRIILRPEEEGDPEVRRRLARLNAWDTTTVYPLLLHLLDRRKQGTATSAQIASAMLYVESFFIRRLLVGRATASINRILLRVVTDMRADLPVDEAVRAYLSVGRKYYATDSSIRDAVRSMPFYLNGRATQRNLVLQWLEESYGSKEPVKLSSLTIEHVMPQSPTTEWRKVLSQDLQGEESFAEAHEALVHTLGNLTLTGYNSELSNSSFLVKRAQLGKSGISLNQEIAAQKRWGRPEIHARADSLAERIIVNWPGPTEEAGNRSEVPWDVMNKALAALPAGSWTAYGDVAALIGSHPMPVGVRLANHPAPNAHRVLQAEGTVSPGFRWFDASRSDDPRDLLRAEGVEFDKYGRASQAQRFNVEELAQLAGMPQQDTSKQLLRARSHRKDLLDDRFVEQLTDLQDPQVAVGVTAVLEAWASMGGMPLYGSGGETSCFLMARGKDHELGNIWPATIYPSGKFEIVFQHLSTRTPFDDIALREEFRRRLNELPGVKIAAAKLALRPGFPLDVLVDPKARAALIEHLGWFYQQTMHPKDAAAERLGWFAGLLRTPRA